jgi:hypothetical protein
VRWVEDRELAGGRAAAPGAAGGVARAGKGLLLPGRAGPASARAAGIVNRTVSVCLATVKSARNAARRWSARSRERRDVEKNRHSAGSGGTAGIRLTIRCTIPRGALQPGHCKGGILESGREE